MVNMTRKMPTAISVPRCSFKPITPFAHAALSTFSPSTLSALAINACSVMPPSFSSRTMRAVVEDEHAIAAADQFVVIRRVEQDRRARFGEVPQQLVEFLLGADVDAACRIVEQNDPRPAHQPLGDDDLLLVAARERADRNVETGRLDGQQLHHLVDQPLFLFPLYDAVPATPGPARRRTDFREPSSAASGPRSCGPPG